MDGVYAKQSDGTTLFHPLPAPSDKTIVISTELANHLNPALKTQQHYYLVLSEDGFRISKKERFSVFKNKWELLHL